MVNAEILAYIKKAKGENKKEEEIRSKLISVGWSASEVDAALNNDDDDVPRPPEARHIDSTDQSSAWDAFEHILMFISLYVMATSIGLILIFYVDKWLPGVQIDNYGYFNSDWQLGLLRGYIAALIVSLPLFSYFFLNITKRTFSNPAIRKGKTRRNLIYLTLVITFIIMLISVITTVYNFLSGNATINFILHILIILGISGGVFAYYLNQVKEDRKQSHA